MNTLQFKLEEFLKNLFKNSKIHEISLSNTNTLKFIKLGRGYSLFLISDGDKVVKVNNNVIELIGNSFGFNDVIVINEICKSIVASKFNLSLGDYKTIV